MAATERGVGRAARKASGEVGVLAALSACMLLPALGTGIAHVALPTLASEFGAPMAHVQWVVLAYLLATTALLVNAGRLGDLLGRRRLLCGGLLLFVAGSLSCGVAPGLGWLVAARVLHGAGAAVLMALTMAFVADAVPKARTGQAMGLLGTMSAVGTAAGPAVGGWLIAEAGWRAIFFSVVPLGVLALVLVRRWLPADRIQAGPVRFDPAGTVWLSLTLVAFALSMTLHRGHFGATEGVLLAGAAASLVLFLRAEARVQAPMVRLALLRDPSLRSSLAAGACVATVVMATLVVGPFYLAGALGLSATQAGLAMSAGPAVAALTGIPAGRWVDRLGAARVARAGLSAMFAGCAMLCTVTAAWGVAGYVLPLSVLTAGYAAFQAANNTLAMSSVAAHERGVVSGLVNLARNLGFIVGASAMGALFASAPGVVQGLAHTFAAGAALMAAALWMSRARKAGVEP